MGVMIERKKRLMMMQIGGNLFTRDGEIDNSYVGNDGNRRVNTTSTGGWISSDWIKVLPNKTYTFNPNSTEGGAAKHVYYDENKSFISYINSGPQTFTTPSNVVYMLFSYRNHPTILN